MLQVTISAFDKELRMPDRLLCKPLLFYPAEAKVLKLFLYKLLTIICLKDTNMVAH